MQLNRLPVDSSAGFASGVMVTRVSQRRRFDSESRSFSHDQDVDQESGLPIWVVEGYDVAAMQAAPLPTKAGGTWRPPAEVRVYVLAAVEPVIPDSTGAGGLRGVVEFDRLAVTPYIDDKRCVSRTGAERHEHGDGERDRCGCRIAVSFRAYGMRPFRG